MSCSQFAIGGDEVVLAPALETAAEAQIARRPWLLDVLSKKPESKQDAGASMLPTPPPNRPRVSDPPSMKDSLANVPLSRDEQSDATPLDIGTVDAAPVDVYAHKGASVLQHDERDDDNWVPRSLGRALRAQGQSRPTLAPASPRKTTSEVTPELMPEPEVAREPELTPEPEVTPKPEVAAKPEVTAKSFNRGVEVRPKLVPLSDPTVNESHRSVKDSQAENSTNWEDSERSSPPSNSSDETMEVQERFDIEDSEIADAPHEDAELDSSFAEHLRNAKPVQRKLRSVTIDPASPGGFRLEPAPRQREASEAADASLPRRRSNSVGDQFAGEPPADESLGDREPVSLDYVGMPTGPLKLSASVAKMKPVMQRCLVNYYRNPEIANQRSNWGMLHSIMVYGVDTKIVAERQHFNAIAWIAGNNACRGQRLIETDRDGIHVRSGVGLQGHQAQMLCVFSLCDVPIEYPLYVGTTKYSVRDVVKREMADCKSGAELTFTLIGLSHYLDTDASWLASDGSRWDFERLIREELSQPIVGAACGGTHRLMGFSHALRKRRAEGRPITGQWARAEVFTNDFIEYAFSLQNRDGSMSTNWFEGREDNGKMDRKVQTTGHMVEWMLTTLPDSQLQDPRLVRAVRYLLASMYNEPKHDWQIGPKGHALRALAMYYQRTYRSGPAWQTPAIASGARTLQR
ncbi:hypothetical protein [Novipirellula galeiformis]|uniref:hypothetical protein n=1 Tax=Novipirellula galeiformis TaxID=2528004 RepID=UPI0011B3DD89|nr:hypothetical protein [Novipirellula galeiformis]